MRLSRRPVPTCGTLTAATVGLAFSLHLATAVAAAPASQTSPADEGWKVTVEKSAPTEDAANTITGPFRMRLGFSDERAALQALQFALNEVGDGSTFVWHRKKGVLSGKIKPTTAFIDEKNRLCRHLVFSLSAGDHNSTIEGIACRSDDGLWKL